MPNLKRKVPFVPLWPVVLAAPFVIGVASVVVSRMAVTNIDVLSVLDGDTVDQVSSLCPPIALDSRIVLVTADKGTSRALGYSSETELVHKVDFAKVLKRLVRASARIVILDARLNSPSLDPPPSGDSSLLEAVQSLGQTQVIVPAIPIDDIDRDEPKADAGVIGGFRYRFVQPAFLTRPVRNLYVGHTVALKPGVFVTGMNPQLHDFETDKPILHVVAIASLLSTGADLGTVRLTDSGDRLVFDRGSWPLLDIGNVQILYTPNWKGIPRRSIQECLRATDQDLERQVAGKFVVLGDARLGQDTVSTAQFGDIPGVYFVAHALNSMLTDKTLWPTRVPEPVAVIAYGFAASVTSWLALMGRRRWRLIGPIVFVVLSFACAPLLIVSARLLVGVVEPTIVVLLAWLVSALVGLFKFGPLDVRQAGRVKEVVTLFVDIKDSTVLTTKLGGDAYQQLYTEFARQSARSVASHGGRLERTTGDGFIATFEDRESRNAVNRAVQVASDSIKLAVGLGDMKVKSGIELGPVSGGYVDEGGRKVWTSQGPSVNLAQRLLGVADETGEPVVLGPEAAGSLGKPRPLGKFKLKGFEGETEAFAPGDGEGTLVL